MSDELNHPATQGSSDTVIRKAPPNWRGAVKEANSVDATEEERKLKKKIDEATDLPQNGSA